MRALRGISRKLLQLSLLTHFSPRSYVYNLQFMFKQYAVYSVLAYFIMSSNSKKASGILGFDAIKYLIRVDFIEPGREFFATGKWQTKEELSNREKAEIKRRNSEASRLSTATGSTRQSGFGSIFSSGGLAAAGSPTSSASTARTNNYSNDSGATDVTDNTGVKSIKCVPYHLPEPRTILSADPPFHSLRFARTQVGQLEGHPGARGTDSAGGPADP